MDLKQDSVTQGIEFEGFIRSINMIRRMQRCIRDNVRFTSFNEDFYNGGCHGYCDECEYDADDCSGERLRFPSEVEKLLTSSFNMPITSTLWKRPHYDTGNSTEIDSLPFNNLGDLMDNIRDILSLVYKHCNEKEYFYILMGVSPVSSYAGGHIHCSTSLTATKLRDKLYVYQPFISLLGQNSSLIQKYVPNLQSFLFSLSKEKDTRISKGFNKRGLCYKERVHNRYGNLITGMLRANKVHLRNGNGTLEVRHPSASSLYQALGTASFIKACLFHKGNDLEEQSYDKTLEYLHENITVYGALTPINLILPNEKKIILPIGRVFSMMINSSPFTEGLEQALKELNGRDRRKIRRFFSIFGEGYSMTNYYNAVLRKFSSVVSRCKAVHKLGEQEFLKGIPIVDTVIPEICEVPMKMDPFIPPLPTELYGITDQVKEMI